MVGGADAACTVFAGRAAVHSVGPAAGLAMCLHLAVPAGVAASCSSIAGTADIPPE